MSHATHILVLGSALQMCGGGGSEPAEDPSTEFLECADYQFMMDFEMTLGRECESDEACTQVIFLSLGSCRSDSVIFEEDFNTTFAAELYDEATEAGCTLELPTSDDCEATEAACVEGACSWR